MSSKKIKDPAPPEEGKISKLRRRLRNVMSKSKDKEKKETDDERSTRAGKPKKKEVSKDATLDATVEEKSKRVSKPKRKKSGTLRKRNKEGSLDQQPSSNDAAPGHVVPRKKTSADGKQSTPQQQQHHGAPPIAAATTPPPQPFTGSAKNSRETIQQSPVAAVATVLNDDGDQTQSCSESIKRSTKALRRKKATDEGSKDKEPTVDEHQPSRKNNNNLGKLSQEGCGSPVNGAPRIPPSQNVKKFVERACQQGVGKLRVEFLTMKKEKAADPIEHKAFLANPSKNRYHDVYCHETTRVKLTGHIDGNDYIHANYVATELSPKRFICAQGPNAATVYDFWHMIVQEGCQSIVMLCGVIENNSPKCVQYWSEKEGETIQFRDISVKTLQKQQPDVTKGVHLTTLYVKSPVKEMTLQHYQMLTWPDKGVPKNPDTIFNLLAFVRTNTKPILVHCSAGIGRTGSFVMIEMILDRIARQIAIPDMPDLLKLLRKQRANCVQTDMQYLFVHIAIMKYFTRIKLVSADTPGLQKFFDDYEKVFPTAALIDS